MKKILLLAVCFLMPNEVFPATSLSAVEISEYWQQQVSQSTVEVDHAPWDEFLLQYVSSSEGVNLVSYGSVTQGDKRELSEYIAYLESIQVTALNQEEQIAYWINLYNALIVQVILENYPVNSILEISDGLLVRGPWKRKVARVEDFELSLDDIEHNILRPIFTDNRVHYALNCASIGCPNLQREAFTRANLDRLLNLGAEEYINHERGVSIEQEELVVSSIYDWFAEDFGENDRQILGHLMRFAKPALLAILNTRKSIDRYQYDWSLNDTK
jgi:hypothetical protein